MTAVIVITSIFSPTEAVRQFAGKPGYRLLVVGDKKTPAGWQCKGASFLGAEQQAKLPYALVRRLPWNHYARKMIGYLAAIGDGAEVIVDTDDDNFPKHDWAFPPFDGAYDTVESDLGFVNVYQLYTDRKIWPRGLPLNVINRDFGLHERITQKRCIVGIWQGLADADPDVDAVYRLTDDRPCIFDRRRPVVLGERTVSPFNSQNTQFRKALFPLLYLPAFVDFRFTDILRGLVAQPIMWSEGYRLGFVDATVVQERNPHDYMADFRSELKMYLQSEKVIDIVAETLSPAASLHDKIYGAYEGLLKAGIVVDAEMAILSAWLKDLG